MNPDEVIQTVKDAGLRGRGGAGFPTGMKWSFIRRIRRPTNREAHYLVVNADESEPGTCKDIPMMFATPHTLIEGVVIAAYAIRAAQAFVYVRGEVVRFCGGCRQRWPRPTTRGISVATSSVRATTMDIVVHAGAGA